MPARAQWVCRPGETASNLKLIDLGWSVRLRVAELLPGLLKVQALNPAPPK